MKLEVLAKRFYLVDAVRMLPVDVLDPFRPLPRVVQNCPPNHKKGGHEKKKRLQTEAGMPQ